MIDRVTSNNTGKNSDDEAGNQIEEGLFDQKECVFEVLLDPPVV